MLKDDKLDGFLASLHERSRSEEEGIFEFFGERFRKGIPIDLSAGSDKTFMADKFVALDRDKAAYCYSLCRAIRARRVVEAGTSFGVSTLWLAAALRDNGWKAGEGIVIGTEYESTKAREARSNFQRAGLSDLIDLREGDLRETLRVIEGPIDFMLVDIWIPMARLALERVLPHLRKGAIVICDNTQDHRDLYADYFAFLSSNGFLTVTLPFAGGLEFSVYLGG